MFAFLDGVVLPEASARMPRPAMKPSFEVAPPDTGVLPQEILLPNMDVKGKCILAGRRCQRSTFAFSSEA